MARADEFPNLSRMSMDDIINALYEAKQDKKDAEMLEGYYKEALKARMPDDMEEYENDRFVVLRAVKTRTGLSKDLIEQEYDQEWIEAHSKTTEYTEIRVKAKEE